jgi:hypothetical protein
MMAFFFMRFSLPSDHPILKMEIVMVTRIAELFGLVFGYIIGIFFAGGSILRNSRFFHPRGLLFCGELEALPDSPIPLPPHVLIRFSSGWWKYKEWPDVLGISLRLSESPVRNIVPLKNDRDFLFASFRHPWELPVAPFFTDHHDYLANSYYAISPFRLKSGEYVEFMIDPSRGNRTTGTREEKLTGNVMSGKVILRLLMKTEKQESWKLIGRIRVRDESDMDQEALRFHPFLTGRDLRPAGFIQHLRYGTYRLSQWVRPGSEIQYSSDSQNSRYR